jgi:hypothetical protein
MKEKLKNSWNRTPTSVRKPLVLVIGLLFIITAGLIGWLPGPGGIPLFLIGIAILATEFAWAHRIKVIILDIIHGIGHWYRRHRIIGTIVFVVLAIASAVIAYLAYRFWRH